MEDREGQDGKERERLGGGRWVGTGREEAERTKRKEQKKKEKYN